MKSLIFLSLLVTVAWAYGIPGRPLSGGVSETQVAEDYEPVVFAVQAINDDFATQGDTQPRELVEIVRAKTQVVAGQKLYLTLHVTGGAVDEYCDIEVVFVSWYEVNDPRGKRLEVVDGPDCTTQSPMQKYMPGGEYPVDEIDEEILTALYFAVDSYNGRSNSARIFKPSVSAEEIEITKQTVAGYIYRFKNMPLTETECVKMQGSTIDLEQCDEKDNGRDVTCNIAVLRVLWETPQYSIHNMICREPRETWTRMDRRKPNR